MGPPQRGLCGPSAVTPLAGKILELKIELFLLIQTVIIDGNKIHYCKINKYIYNFIENLK